MARSLEDGREVLFCSLLDGPDNVVEIGIDVQLPLKKSDQEFDLNHTWGRAITLMWVMLGKVSTQETNTIKIASTELRTLVWPHRAKSKAWPRNWRPVIGRALELLQHVSLYYHPLKGQSTHRRYRFIETCTYKGSGKGGHGDGAYEVRLSNTMLGILNTFATDAPPPSSDGTPKKWTFNFKKKLADEDKWRIQGGKAGKAGDSYVKGDPLLPFYLSTANCTPAQMNLYEYLIQNITLNKDASKRPSAQSGAHNVSPDAPRLYTRQFCEELPHPEGMVGALGHFSGNPESGFYLKTLAAKCYPLPPAGIKICHKEWTKQIQKDLEHVVVKTLGGIVVGHHPTKNLPWIRLDELTTLSPEVSWNEILVFCFFPTNYEQVLLKAWQNIVGPHALEDKNESDDKLRLQIRLALKKNDVKRKDLAAWLGITPSTLTYWLTLHKPTGGKRSTPIPDDAIPRLHEWLDPAVRAA